MVTGLQQALVGSLILSISSTQDSQWVPDHYYFLMFCLYFTEDVFQEMNPVLHSLTEMSM